MESVVEEVEHQGQTEGGPANSQSCEKLGGVEHSGGVFLSIRNQNDHDIDTEANVTTINDDYSIHFNYPI